MILLDVKDLSVSYRVKKGVLRAVDRVSFKLERGKTLALIGESGSGKSTTALALMRVLPRNTAKVEGSIIFDGVDLLKLDEERFRRDYRWKRISMVFQAAMNVLNPVMSVKDHFVELLRLHGLYPNGMGRVVELLKGVGLSPSVLERYPHELSGGMKQRVVIALALLLDPELIILDEPTSALDVITQANIMRLLRGIRDNGKKSMIFITHDIALAGEIADEIAVMYAGQIVEIGPINEVLTKPRHPYTQGLINSIPRIKGGNVRPIGGEPPNPLDPPAGCRFHPRCPFAKEICKREEPPFVDGVKCWLYV